MPIVDEERVRDVVQQARTVAVLGAHPQTWRPAHYVPAYLCEQGLTCLPVNPRFQGQELFGHEVAARLADLEQEVDVVDVFRPSVAIPGHVEDILAMAPRPRLVWLQSGIRHDEAAAELEAAGIEVIQDRCLLVDHRRWGSAA